MTQHISGMKFALHVGCCEADRLCPAEANDSARLSKPLCVTQKNHQNNFAFSLPKNSQYYTFFILSLLTRHSVC